MKIEPKRLILCCVLLCGAFVFNTKGNAQLRSILLPQIEGTRAARLPHDEHGSPASRQLVMHANEPSDDLSILATSHCEEVEQLPQTDSVNMTSGHEKPIQCTTQVVVADAPDQDVEPEEPIVVKIEAPKRFILGVPYRVYATVQNPTRSSISNVQISVKSSAHLRSTPGFASFQTVAKLASRHSARFEFEIFGVEPGNAELYFDATAKFEAEPGTELAESTNPLIQLGSSEIIEVYKPAIRANFTGPEFVHLGSQATYGIEVINESGSPLATTDVLLSVPEQLNITILDRIAYKRSDGQILWRVEDLQPGKSELIQFKAKSTQSGVQTQHVDLAIQNRVFAQATCDTDILGPSKLQVEVQDPFAAIPIGEVAKLNIKIRNGDNYDNELQLKVSLPESVHAVNSENLQSNERNEVWFKPMVVGSNSEVQLEVPLVGSAIGGQTIQATVTSKTTLISRAANRIVIFVNPQNANGRVTHSSPPVNFDPAVSVPGRKESPVSAANLAAPQDTVRTAHQVSSSKMSGAHQSEVEFHATIPGQQTNSMESTTSLAPGGYSESAVPASHFKRVLPLRIRPLLVTRRKRPEHSTQQTTSSASESSNRRQPDIAEPDTMLPPATEPSAQPGSNSILINRR